MTAKDKFLGKLSLEKSQATGLVAADRDETTKEWSVSLNTLFDQMESWLKTAIDEQLLTVDRIQTEVNEPELGDFETPELILTTPRGHKVHIGHDVRLVIGFMGKVVLKSGPQKSTLYRTSDKKWVIGVRDFSKLNTFELNEDNFLEMIMELLP